jgi:hypothetical protein
MMAAALTAASLPNAAVIDLQRGGSIRLNGRSLPAPQLPAALALHFAATPERRILVRTEYTPETRETMRTLRRFAQAAASAAPSGNGSAIVVSLALPHPPRPAPVSLSGWLFSRFLRRPQ